jgi:hypothetical protein
MEATIEYKDSPNESTAYAVTGDKKSTVQLVATPAGDLELSTSPNVSTGYLSIDGQKHKVSLVHNIEGELELPKNATSDSGYVKTQDGKKHKVRLTANISVGGGGGGASTTKYGVTIDAFLGDAPDGVLQAASSQEVLNFSGLKEIGTNALNHAFCKRNSLVGVDLGSVQKIGPSGLINAFWDCSGIESVNLSSLQSVDNSGMYWAFRGCYKIKRVDLSSLQSVAYNGLCDSFNGCSGIESVNLSSLQSVDGAGLAYAFRTSKITTMSFPALTSVVDGCFGSASYNYTFGSCTALTEIHFRADMQATIEALNGYSDKWGASNATIYFDL